VRVGEREIFQLVGTPGCAKERGTESEEPGERRKNYQSPKETNGLEGGTTERPTITKRDGMGKRKRDEGGSHVNDAEGDPGNRGQPFGVGVLSDRADALYTLANPSERGKVTAPAQTCLGEKLVRVEGEIRPVWTLPTVVWGKGEGGVTSAISGRGQRSIICTNW